MLSSSYKPWQLLFAGIEMDDEELARFVEHVDMDNNGIITFDEWRDFLLLYPHEATIENIYHYWEKGLSCGYWRTGCHSIRHQ